MIVFYLIVTIYVTRYKKPHCRPREIVRATRKGDNDTFDVLHARFFLRLPYAKHSIVGLGTIETIFSILFSKM